jgi:putative transposase
VPFEYKQFYRRKLPHIHSPGATLFVTFRLAGSIPKRLLDQWKRERNDLDRRSEGEADTDQLNLDFHRRWFGLFEDALHHAGTGPLWLGEPTVADAVAESLVYRDAKDYSLIAYCIMSNHVHVVFRPLMNERDISEISCTNPLRFVSENRTPSAIMQSLKGYTAREANKLLGRTGKFWQEESYDHQVRDEEELARIIQYVLNNPIKAGIVSDWRHHKWTWLNK